MDLPLSAGLIFYALKKEREQTAWELWLAKYPHMTKENFIAFEDFRDKLYPKTGKITQKTKMEIQKEMLVLAVTHRSRKEV